MNKKTTRPSGGYEVGYGRPPKATQFKKGQSGNPAGRKPRAVHLFECLEKELKRPVKVREGDRTQTISSLQGIIRALTIKALKGDPRAFQQIIDLICNQLDRESARPEPQDHELSLEDLKTIQDYAEKQLASRSE